jgi:arylsulfatase A-like enzyme
VAVLLATVTALAVVGGCAAQAVPRADGPSTASASPGQLLPSPAPSASGAAPVPSPPGAIKNVVLLLADDLDTRGFRQIPRLRALQDQGLTLRNMVVTDSLCCPSRTSILRSQYVHNHQVISNLQVSGGGWYTFDQKGEEKDCLPTWLHAAGIRTGFVGKYLNGYGEDGDPTAIPPGWDDWFVPTTKSGMYRGYGYTVNDNGALKTYGVGRKDFLNDVITTQAVRFIRTAEGPFYLQVNSTAPHDPAPVSPRHRGSHSGARAPRNLVFNDKGINPPRWRSHKKPINSERMARYDRYWQQRLESTETFADTVQEVIAALRAKGVLDETLIVVTSDNGFHVASRRLPPGKRTPYREDIVVPAVAIGPGISPGSRSNAMTSTIDLGPTFASVLGATAPDWTDGRSLEPLLADPRTTQWRTGVLSESLGESTFADPDYQTIKPPKFHALRTKQWLYVEYVTGARELYDRRTDPYESRNVVDSVDPAIVTSLSEHLAALITCSGPTCRSADTW